MYDDNNTTLTKISLFQTVIVKRENDLQKVTPVDPEGQRDPTEAMEEDGTLTLFLTPCGKKDYIKMSLP